MNQKNKIFTIPNLLSCFRICLIPLIIWLYCVQENNVVTALILILSGLTDVVDGFIARRFHMISNLGKMLDPVADKATQGAMLFCLITRYPTMLQPLSLLVIKEAFVGATSLIVIKKTGNVIGADLHGKITTCLLYIMMILHVLWHDMPLDVSDTLIDVCVIMMVISMVLYGVRNLSAVKSKEKKAV